MQQERTGIRKGRAFTENGFISIADMYTLHVNTLHVREHKEDFCRKRVPFRTLTFVCMYVYFLLCIFQPIFKFHGKVRRCPGG